MTVNIPVTLTAVKDCLKWLICFDSSTCTKMRSSKVVRLRHAKEPFRRLTLVYHPESHGLLQQRLRGRYALLPDLDLKDYSCRAVLDWVSVTFELDRPSQFQHIQKQLQPIVGRRLYVDPRDAGPGGVTRTFTLRLQDATLSLLHDCRAQLTARYGVAAEPIVNEVEVSVDFTPVVPADEARYKMVAVLCRHLFTARQVTNRASTRPRFSWGKLSKQNGAVVGDPRIKADNSLLNPAGDSPAPVDATYYIGHRKIGPLWRVMDKVLDRQNRNAGTWVKLKDSEKRARVEVRLDKLELSRLGVITLSDLTRMNLARLQGEYFRFMLPTFLTINPTTHAADLYWERVREERFLNAGVLGLSMLDKEREQQRRSHRKSLIRYLRPKQKPVPVAKRTARGPTGTFISYQSLNDRVSMALRKLMERERKG